MSKTLVSDSETYRLACACIQQDYDYVLTVSPATRCIIQALSSTALGSFFVPGADYERTVSRLMRQNILPDDIGTLAEDISLERVIRELETSPRYTHRFTGEYVDGELRVKEFSFRYLDEEKSEICMTRQDITASARDELLQNRKLSTALETAMQANDAKSEFLSRMSHDMRTPLNGVIGMTRLALEETSLDRAQKYMEQVELSGTFLLGLINDILDMSRIESGKLELHPEPYALKEFLDYIRAVVTPLCQARHQSFELSVSCGELVVLVDKLRFNQIFFNLLSNASKFTQEGGTICFSMRSFDVHHGERGSAASLYFSVSDNGVGMSRSFLNHIYEPFTREETGACAQTCGSGLGLSIVHSLVQLLRGSLKIDSEPGAGTRATVSLLLPLAELKETAPPAADGASALEGELAGCRVLLAEDNSVNTIIMNRLLKKQGITVEHAEDGLEAFEMFMESEPGHFSAVLMDVRMPVMDGLQATRSIRALSRPDAQSIPIIAVTANAFDSDVQECLSAGMNDHLRKPIEPEKLAELMRKYCPKSCCVGINTTNESEI